MEPARDTRAVEPDRHLPRPHSRGQPHLDQCVAAGDQVAAVGEHHDRQWRRVRGSAVAASPSRRGWRPSESQRAGPAAGSAGAGTVAGACRTNEPGTRRSRRPGGDRLAHELSGRGVVLGPPRSWTGERPTRGPPDDRRIAMPEYLLSVHHVEGEPMPTDMRRCSRSSTTVDRFNTRLQAEAGSWVFAGGLMPRETATDRRRHRRGGAVDRRAVRGVQGVPRRLLGHRGPRPRRRPAPGPPRVGARARARSRSGRSRPSRRTPPRSRPPDVPDEPTTRSSGSSGRSTAGWSPRWPAASVTSTSPRRPPARRCSSPLERWPVDGIPPNPGGWLTTTAGNRAIDRIRRESQPRRQAPAGRDDPRPRRPTSRPAPSPTTGSG